MQPCDLDREAARLGDALEQRTLDASRVVQHERHGLAAPLDRQTCADLPNIVHSVGTLGWRLVNCFGFAATTLFVLLPPLLAIQGSPGAVWNEYKLRFVASGATFCVALSSEAA